MHLFNISFLRYQQGRILMGRPVAGPAKQQPVDMAE